VLEIILDQLQIIKSECKTMVFIEVFQFFFSKIYKPGMCNNGRRLLLCGNLKHRKIFFLTLDAVNQMVFYLVQIFFGYSEKLDDFPTANSGIFISGKERDALLGRVGALVILSRKEFRSEMKLRRRIIRSEEHTSELQSR